MTDQEYFVDGDDIYIYVDNKKFTAKVEYDPKDNQWYAEYFNNGEYLYKIVNPPTNT